MKTTGKKWTWLFFSLAMMILMLAPALTAQAASPSFEKKLTLYYYDNTGSIFADGTVSHGSFIDYVKNSTAKGKISKLKSSNTKVVEAGSIGTSMIDMKVKAVGKSTISFQYGGKKFSCQVTVKKWVNPCKSFKIGGKDYAKYFEKSLRYNLLGQKTKTAKISVQPKSGWKLLQLKKRTIQTGAYCQVLKNNKTDKISVSGTGTGLYAIFQNKKTKEKVTINLGYGAKGFSMNLYESALSEAETK